jgi:hypothetical protein
LGLREGIPNSFGKTHHKTRGFTSCSDSAIFCQRQSNRSERAMSNDAKMRNARLKFKSGVTPSAPRWRTLPGIRSRRFPQVNSVGPAGSLSDFACGRSDDRSLFRPKSSENDKTPKEVPNMNGFRRSACVQRNAITFRQVHSFSPHPKTARRMPWFATTVR